MSANAHPVGTRPDAAAVLSKAVTRSAERLSIPRNLLARILEQVPRPGHDRPTAAWSGPPAA